MLILKAHKVREKLILLAAVAVFGFITVNIQNMRLGINAGLPMGEAGDISSFSLNLDLNYLWSIADRFDAGIAAGFSHSFGKNPEIEWLNINRIVISFLLIAVALLIFFH